MLIPPMEKQGYTRKFAAAITAASSVIGPIIPPSGIMIIYAYVMGESVAALFLAGVIPGAMVGIGLMLMVKFMANKYDFPVATNKYTWPERGQASLKAFSKPKNFNKIQFVSKKFFLDAELMILFNKSNIDMISIPVNYKIYTNSSIKILSIENFIYLFELTKIIFYYNFFKKKLIKL